MLVLNGFWIALFQNYVQQPCIIFIMSTVTEIEISFIDHYWCISKWAHIYAATTWQWVVKRCWSFRTWTHRNNVIYWNKLEYSNIYLIVSFEDFYVFYNCSLFLKFGLQGLRNCTLWELNLCNLERSVSH